MGILQKNPFTQDVGKQMYSFGHNKTVLIVGLGNIGKKYLETRHNLGFMCVDYFAHTNEFPQWIEKKDMKGYISQKTLGETRVMLLKPSTMMNRSGEAVRAIADFYKISAENTFVVHDELDIPFGQIRTRMGGGPAGHNGLKDVIKHFGSNFGRVRIGVGSDEKPARMDSSDFVLANLSDKERKELPNLRKEVSSILTEIIYSGELTPETRSFLV
ncbi:MAG: aminoacyl-tRNA hydrolase [Candidatus Saccharibacteria bacterium]|nr:aminoacyl-tRNA hydrolase [Candidatus Saccharibacteria bacterium]